MHRHSIANHVYTLLKHIRELTHADKTRKALRVDQKQATQQVEPDLILHEVDMQHVTQDNWALLNSNAVAHGLHVSSHALMSLQADKYTGAR